MTTTAGPIPLPIVRYYCRAGEERCQHLLLDPNTCTQRCGEPAQHQALITTFWTVTMNLPAPKWCPLRPKVSEE